MGIEPMTPSLPRKCSTPELHRLEQSGKRGSNPRPSAWKADALPTELFPLVRQFSLPDIFCGERRNRTSEGISQQIYSLPQLTALVSPLNIIFVRADGGIRTPDQLITNQLLWPAELHRQFQRTFSFGLQMYELFTIIPIF